MAFTGNERTMNKRHKRRDSLVGMECTVISTSFPWKVSGQIVEIYESSVLLKATQPTKSIREGSLVLISGSYTLIVDPKG